MFERRVWPFMLELALFHVAPCQPPTPHLMTFEELRLSMAGWFLFSKSFSSALNLSVLPTGAEFKVLALKKTKTKTKQVPDEPNFYL